MTDITQAKARLYAVATASSTAGNTVWADDALTILEALEELETSYVPYLPADTDTWLVDGNTEHPLPPGGAVRFQYGLGAAEFLVAQGSDTGVILACPTGAHLAVVLQAVTALTVTAVPLPK